MEHMYLVTANAPRCEVKDHLFYEGTNQGELLGYVKAPNWTDAHECLRVPSSDIKNIIGKAGAIMVGGSNPPGPTKMDSSDGMEPVFHHTNPTELDAEISHSWPATAHLDLTAGQGGRAIFCLQHKLPYHGFCMTEEHKAVLTKFLETNVFKMMQMEGNKLYQPGLAALLVDTDEGDDAEGEEEEADGEEDEDHVEVEESAEKQVHVPSGNTKGKAKAKGGAATEATKKKATQDKSTGAATIENCPLVQPRQSIVTSSHTHHACTHVPTQYSCNTALDG